MRTTCSPVGRLAQGLFASLGRITREAPTCPFARVKRRYPCRPPKLDGGGKAMPSARMPPGRVAPGANRGQPSNSKGGNWWQSPFCGSHTGGRANAQAAVLAGDAGAPWGRVAPDQHASVRLSAWSIVAKPDTSRARSGVGRTMVRPAVGRGPTRRRLAGWKPA
jgi:hypothetical protein